MKFTQIEAAFALSTVVAATAIPSTSPTPYSNNTVIIAPVFNTTIDINIDVVIGIEIINYISIEEVTNIYEGSTITEYVTSCYSTAGRPIYTNKPGYPDYAACLAGEGVYCPAGGFFTATTSIIKTPVPTGHPVYVAPHPVVKPCSSCTVYTVSTAPVCNTALYGTEYVTKVNSLTATAPYTTTSTITSTCNACAVATSTIKGVTTPAPVSPPTTVTSAVHSVPAPPASSRPAAYTGGAAVQSAGVVLGAAMLGLAML